MQGDEQSRDGGNDRSDAGENRTKVVLFMFSHESSAMERPGLVLRERIRPAAGATLSPATMDDPTKPRSRSILRREVSWCSVSRLAGNAQAISFQDRPACRPAPSGTLAAFTFAAQLREPEGRHQPTWVQRRYGRHKEMTGPGSGNALSSRMASAPGDRRKSAESQPAATGIVASNRRT